MWKTSANVMPIVVGALGTVASLDEDMNMLYIEKREVDRVQFSVLLGSAKILKRVLDISS